MSILTQQLPDTITVSGGQYPIRTDFRVWLEFTSLMLSEKPAGGKAVEMLVLLFDTLPPSFHDTWEAVLKFYTGSSEKQKNGGEDSTGAKRIYDFEADADYIYAAFLQQYQIDLQRARLHWWTFRALFHALGEDTQFIKIVSYRSMDLSKIKNREQREMYAKLKKQYALPTPQAEREQIDRIQQALLNGGDLTGIL